MFSLLESKQNLNKIPIIVVNTATKKTKIIGIVSKETDSIEILEVIKPINLIFDCKISMKTRSLTVSFLVVLVAIGIYGHFIGLYSNSTEFIEFINANNELLQLASFITLTFIMLLVSNMQRETGKDQKELLDNLNRQINHLKDLTENQVTETVRENKEPYLIVKDARIEDFNHGEEVDKKLEFKLINWGVGRARNIEKEFVPIRDSDKTLTGGNMWVVQGEYTNSMLSPREYVLCEIAFDSEEVEEIELTVKREDTSDKLVVYIPTDTQKLKEMEEESSRFGVDQISLKE